MCSINVSGSLVAAVGEWHSEAGAAVFRVETSGAGGARTVLRRYSEFAALAREQPMARELPPRSFFRKRLLGGFMEQRRRGLDAFLSEVLAADAHASSPAVRAFLGLPGVEDCFGETEGETEDCFGETEGFDDESDASADSFLLDRDLYTIAEGERENGTFVVDSI